MCNEIRRRIALAQARDDFAQLRIPLRFPEGAPNLAPLDSVRITDPTLIVRASPHDGEPEALVRRWSWKGPTGKPVFNYRSEGRRFPDSARQGRCLIPADGFYEFTAPAPSPKPARSTTSRRTRLKHLFTHAADDWFCIAGLWRIDPAAAADADPRPKDREAERFTMLTCDPGPDVAPFHNRQIVVLARADWHRWLDPAERDVRDLCRPSPAGTFRVAPIA